MNIIEVSKKENLGKEYKVFLDGKDLGIWTVVESETNGEFDFYQKYKVLSDHYVSQILRMEFAEVIDWSEMPIDTKMLVSKDNEIWFRRYFAKYEDGKIYCFRSGASSFSADDEDDIMVWKYVKLYEE